MKRYDVFFDDDDRPHATHYGPSLYGFLFGGFRHIFHGDWPTGLLGIILSVLAMVFVPAINTIISLVFLFCSNQWLRKFYAAKYGEPVAVRAGSNREAIQLAIRTLNEQGQPEQETPRA